MQQPVKRRAFLKTTATAGLTAVFGERLARFNTQAASGSAKPVVIASGNGYQLRYSASNTTGLSE